LSIDESLRCVYEGPTDMRWGDLDAYGHVNNVRFFDYFQEARVIWLTHSGVRMDDPNFGFVVVHVSCDFTRELNYPAKLLSRIDVVKTGRSSITLIQTVCDLNDPDTIYGKGQTVMVWRDHQAGHACQVPESLLPRLLVTL
jgi:acyl-CoA thioester hydrolase